MWSDEVFSASDIETIRGQELDFILRFAFGIVRREILRVPCTERLDGGVVLTKRAFDTMLHSYARNRDVGLFGGTAWPAEVCRDLLTRREEYPDDAPSTSAAPIFHAPSNREMLRFAVTLGRNSLRHSIRRRPSSR